MEGGTIIIIMTERRIHREEAAPYRGRGRGGQLCDETLEHIPPPTNATAEASRKKGGVAGGSLELVAAHFCYWSSACLRAPFLLIILRMI